jgi:two-component system LytT family response regulator
MTSLILPLDPPHLTVLRGQKLLVADIEYLQADRNYTLVYLTNGHQLLLSKTLKYYAAQLLPHGFVRCHKSYLVNVRCIIGHMLGNLCLQSGVRVEVSRRRKNQIWG